MLRRLATALTTLAMAATGALVCSPAGAADPFSVRTLHFKVSIGPDQTKVCDIVGDLYTPTAATSSNRMPAILTTNGFGGSKDDQAGFGRTWASRGYVVLSYSGLGFGGSGCKITLDDPDWDGIAGSQLISYLGGAGGIAYLDAAHTQPAAALNVVKLDGANDPRVGMLGGSYGGSIQFAIASVDPRLDAIVPMITWNDLSYSLGPNGTSQNAGVSTTTPGAVKLNWGAGFSIVGVQNGLTGAQGDPTRLVGCPNFADWVCLALITGGALGYFQPDTIAKMRHASVASYLSKVRIPTLLLQGQYDTLFNLNEAAATYQALRAQGTPVKMVWHKWGHSQSAPAPGEFNKTAPNPATEYESARIDDWFSRYLKGQAVDTGPSFSYFRDWISYTGNAKPAYGVAGTFPVGTSAKYYLSGGSLTPSTTLAKASQSFLTVAAGAPTSTTQLDALNSYVPIPLPEQDLPGTFATYQTAPLSAARNVVGSPRLTLKVSSPTAALTQLTDAGKLVLFVRLQDVAPDGTVRNIRNLTAPVRVPDVNKPFTATLPGIVYRFAAGHQIRLVVTGGSVNYRGGATANAVTIATGSTSQVLSLPVVP